MDPITKLWMFENWQADQIDNAELAKNHAYLLGSFWNPEAVKKLMGDDNSHISSDEDLKKSMKMVKDGEGIPGISNSGEKKKQKQKRKRKIKV